MGKNVYDVCDIRKQLELQAEEKYREFQKRLLPGVDEKSRILGVRMGNLRKIGKQIAKGNYEDYLRNAEAETFEEIMLKGIVIGCSNMKFEDRIHFIAEFVPFIQNWSVCDSFVSGLKFIREAREEYYPYVCEYLNAEKEFEIRFGIVVLINYYRDEEYAERAFVWFDRIKHPGYYVKMAVAWAVAMYFIENQKTVMQYLKKNELDDFTYNKALQKIKESLLISPETKNQIQGMKRKSL